MSQVTNPDLDADTNAVVGRKLVPPRVCYQINLRSSPFVSAMSNKRLRHATVSKGTSLPRLHNAKESEGVISPRLRMRSWRGCERGPTPRPCEGLQPMRTFLHANAMRVRVRVRASARACKCTCLLCVDIRVQRALTWAW